jgi:hypothetical protein
MDKKRQFAGGTLLDGESCANVCADGLRSAPNAQNFAMAGAQGPDVDVLGVAGHADLRESATSSTAMCATLAAQRQKGVSLRVVGIQREVFNDDVIQFAIGEFEKQLRERIRSVRSDIERKRQRRDVLRVEIQNLAEAVAQGHASEALFENLKRRERELDELDNGLLPNREDGIQVKLDQVEKFIRGRFADLRHLSSQNAIAAKAELGKHCDSIWVTPDKDGYTLSGKWNLTAGRSDGAGGPNRTVRTVSFCLSVAA